MWEALVEGDADADAAALCDSFRGVYTDGFAGKSDHCGQLGSGPTVSSYRLSLLRARALGCDHALLSYRADFTRPGQRAPEAMFVSSIWQRQPRQGARHPAPLWRNIFSQDTPADPADPEAAPPVG